MCCGAADQSGGIHGPFRNILSREHLHEQGNRRGAQKFHPIVRRGDLRRAADGKEGIVVACDLKLLRDLPSGVKGVFDSAGGQFVVRGKAGVKGYASVLQLLQETGCLRDSGRAEEGTALFRDAVFGEGTKETGKLLLPAVTEGTVEKDRLPAAKGEQPVRQFFYRQGVVAYHAVGAASGKDAVQEENGELFRGLIQIGVVLLLFLDELGAGQDQGIHPAGQKELQIFFLFRKPVSGAAEHGSVAASAQLPFQQIDDLRQVDVGGIGAQDSHRAHGIQPQASGKRVGRIPVLVHDRKDLPPGRLADLFASV